VRDEDRRPRAQQPALEGNVAETVDEQDVRRPASAAGRSRLMSNRAVPAGSVISSRSVGSAVSTRARARGPIARALPRSTRVRLDAPARRRDQVTSPMRIRRPGSAPRRARGSCARDRSAR
jgi:hypothetical protein